MARTLRRERRFGVALRTAALRTVAEVLPRSDARLLAVAIMSNHLHLVVQQGERPLSDLMQPLLRRLAGLLQKAQAVDGPVFWRPYASQPCFDPEHARNAIVYTHLNPVRAGLCSYPGDYPWTSHALYAGAWPEGARTELGPLIPLLDPSLALPLFATGPDRAVARLRSDYRAFVDWRLAVERARMAGDTAPSARVSTQPWANWGTPGWAASLSPLFHSPLRARSRPHDDRPRPIAPDLATIARNTLAREGGGIPLRLIRGRGGGRERTRVRRAVIARLHAAGYRNVEIARFLDVSESAVSAVVCQQRSAR